MRASAAQNMCVIFEQKEVSSRILTKEPAKRDASVLPAVRPMLMDVLIVEQNELLATVLADALADEGIAAAVVPDDEETLTGGLAGYAAGRSHGHKPPPRRYEGTAVRQGNTEPLPVAWRDLHGGAMASPVDASRRVNGSLASRWR